MISTEAIIPVLGSSSSRVILSVSRASTVDFSLSFPGNIP